MDVFLSLLIIPIYLTVLAVQMILHACLTIYLSYVTCMMFFNVDKVRLCILAIITLEQIITLQTCK